MIHKRDAIQKHTGNDGLPENHVVCWHRFEITVLALMLSAVNSRSSFQNAKTSW